MKAATKILIDELKKMNIAYCLDIHENVFIEKGNTGKGICVHTKDNGTYLIHSTEYTYKGIDVVWHSNTESNLNRIIAILKN